MYAALTLVKIYTGEDIQTLKTNYYADLERGAKGDIE